MSTDLVRITASITLDDVTSGRISRVDAYAAQVRGWILQPGRDLAARYPTETDHGMALLALELMFFEPHGRLLSGQPHLRSSRKLFIQGFDRFRDHLRCTEAIGGDTDELPSDSFYEWARCGLFHSSLLADELLVDAVGYSGRCLAKNPLLGGWLVDPWLVLDALEGYLRAYGAELESDPKSELRRNFDAAFEGLIEAPLQRIAATMPSNQLTPAGSGPAAHRR